MQMKSCNKTRERNKELKAREVHFGLAGGQKRNKANRATAACSAPFYLYTCNCMISNYITKYLDNYNLK